MYRAVASFTAIRQSVRRLAETRSASPPRIRWQRRPGTMSPVALNYLRPGSGLRRHHVAAAILIGRTHHSLGNAAADQRTVHPPAVGEIVAFQEVVVCAVAASQRC